MVKKKKDFGEHDKKTAARDRRAAAEKERHERSSKEQTDQFWAEAGEGAMTKAQAKRREQEKQKLETQAKKQQIKDLAKAEEELVAASKKPKGRPVAPKVTRHELMQEQERQAAELATVAEESSRTKRKEVDEETYARMVEVANLNRTTGDVEARTVAGAISGLEQLKMAPAEDPHPEKRRKAAFRKFFESELADLKEEKPGLKLSQYKDIIFKRWNFSPDNPMNHRTLSN